MIIKIAILGAIQGLTEFFPVSSSGHLVIAQHFLSIKENVVFLDIFLHTGTILALLTFFFKDILKVFKDPKMLGYIATVTIITGVIGITFKRTFESMFLSTHDTAIQLLINAVILLSVPFLKEKNKNIKLPDCIIMGIAQAVSIIPGISRSGATIVSLLARGINREEAFRFSFLASIPAITGAFLVEAKDVNFKNMAFDLRELSAGFITSYLFGILALVILNKIIKKQKLHYFGYYCLLLGTALLYFIKL
jgi:undecaprenyl-diphosphatase